ncbi:addiction module toxin, RelE/StbE family [Solidesulfovibrio carbinoliphilus subsp. oakridgensis]|uniref:Addiction module toxin, RelE/StbE family n=1 Tax=Solidesulfovibrio carbinoliphilus subsp. oakridgensis TaxID=694327 RepID=G7Q909_9BACT|nr:type II toxin-antitoxin system RelE/ParE family toxin [Solidesulfovibrio carbinoliphilus]EHJ47731.1 addiction module toxin, RelE/StbE family [Solidesulfovibrio carbinoliphilus subsp. oakridgensis]
MAFSVLLTEDAVGDLREIDAYLVWRDSAEAAEQVLEKIGQALGSLARQPQRGHHPPELLALGIREYREIAVRPFRIIYQIEEETVHVFLVADGRRDMQRLLLRRLLAAGR